MLLLLPERSLIPVTIAMFEPHSILLSTIRHNAVVGRMNSLVYPVEGGMEDWLYAAGWNKEFLKVIKRFIASSPTACSPVLNVL